jgi:hypothetical protein
MGSKSFFLFTLVFFVPTLFVVSEEPTSEVPREKLKILFEFAPDAVVCGEPFTLNIVVNQTNPDEILVEPPEFNDAFRIEQLRTEARIVQNAVRGGDRWTVFEFTLTALESGVQGLGAFVVSIPEETMLTNPININVREAKPNFKSEFAWFGQNGLSRLPEWLTVGNPREAVLRIIDWPVGKPYPDDSLSLRIEPPKNAIVEYVPLTENERKKGFVLRLRVTAIEGWFVYINDRFVRYGDMLLEIPALAIAVQPVPPVRIVTNAADIEMKMAATVDKPQAVKSVAFSDTTGDAQKIFFMFRVGPEKCLAEAERLWTGKLYAEALLVLRRGERTLTAANLVKNMRKVCENALGLPVCPDEARLPTVPLMFVSVLFTAVAVILFLTRKRRRVQIFYIAASAVIALSALSLLTFSYFDGKGRVVLKLCAAYPVPEETSKSQTFFMEGEPAHIRSTSASWLYVESITATVAGKSGWVKKNDAAF